MRRVKILGCGNALAEKKLMFEDQTRYRLGDGQTLLDLAERAIYAALEEAKLTIKDIDCIIGAMATPLQAIPCNAALIHERVAKGTEIPKMTATEGDVPDVEFTYEDGYTDNGEAAAAAGINPSTGIPNAGEHGKTVEELIVPVEKYGVKWMSIGYFAAPEQALIWRGPMACNALKQMILQVKWGDLDFLLLDLPPGTGDIHISLVHDIPLDGAIIVSTPQAVALADVEKGINMFRNKDINKPVYGLVENMAWFTPAELPNNRYYIFGKDGGKEMAAKYNVPLLGQIPLVQSIRECGDEGEPAAVVAGPVFDAFVEIAKQLN